MKTSGWLCTGMTAGALLMFLFDPQSGRRRRSLLADKVLHYRRLLREGSRATWSDTRNRATGLWAGLLSYTSGEREVPDSVLESRVRSKLGRVVSHPGWLEVKADHGAVKVAGHVPEREKTRLLATVVSIRGVQKVEEDNLVIDPDDQVPDEGRPPGTGYWAPAERLTATLIGMTVGSYGLRRGGFSGSVMALTGLGLVLRGLINMRLTELPSRALPPRQEVS
jgi:hypothetical protein